MDICTIVGAGDGLPAFESPVYLLLFEEPNVITQGNHFRRNPMFEGGTGLMTAWSWNTRHQGHEDEFFVLENFIDCLVFMIAVHWKIKYFLRVLDRVCRVLKTSRHLIVVCQDHRICKDPETSACKNKYTQI